MKKLLQKDGFYLALFACVCIVAVGGVWITQNNVEELTNNELLVEEQVAEQENENEVHLIENDINEEEAVQTSTESKESLETAKKQPESKLHFLGEKITRNHSETEPSYSKTLDLWEIHKGIDVSAKKGSEVKSLLDGTVIDVFKDDEHGMSVKVQSQNNTEVVYSNLDENLTVKKGDVIKEGDTLGKVGETTLVEVTEGPHIHVEVFKDSKSVDPMSVIK